MINFKPVSLNNSNGKIFHVPSSSLMMGHHAINRNKICEKSDLGKVTAFLNKYIGAWKAPSSDQINSMSKLGRTTYTIACNDASTTDISVEALLKSYPLLEKKLSPKPFAVRSKQDIKNAIADLIKSRLIPMANHSDPKRARGSGMIIALNGKKFGVSISLYAQPPSYMFFDPQGTRASKGRPYLLQTYDQRELLEYIGDASTLVLLELQAQIFAVYETTLFPKLHKELYSEYKTKPLQLYNATYYRRGNTPCIGVTLKFDGRRLVCKIERQMTGQYYYEKQSTDICTLVDKHGIFDPHGKETPCTIQVKESEGLENFFEYIGGLIQPIPPESDKWERESLRSQATPTDTTNIVTCTLVAPAKVLT